jgi:hypothetical protein
MSLSLARVPHSYLLPSSAILTSTFSANEPLNASCSARPGTLDDEAGVHMRSAQELTQRYDYWYELGLRTVVQADRVGEMYGAFVRDVASPPDFPAPSSAPQPAHAPPACTLAPISYRHSPHAHSWWSSSQIPCVPPPASGDVRARSTGGLAAVFILEQRDRPIVDKEDFFDTTPRLKPLLAVLTHLDHAFDRHLAAEIAAGRVPAQCRAVCMSFGGVMAEFESCGVMQELLQYAMLSHLHRARLSGSPVDLVYSFASSARAQRLNQRAGMQCIERLKYADFVFHNPETGLDERPFAPVRLQRVLGRPVSDDEGIGLMVARADDLMARWGARWRAH